MCHLTSRDLILTKHIKEETDVPSVETKNRLMGSSVLPGSCIARPAPNMATSLACVTKKKVSFKSRTLKAHQLQVGQMYMQENSICGQSGDLTSRDESFHLQVKIQHTQVNTKIPTPLYLITNLVYTLKPHHKRNQYLRARLDTCADVNIMPVGLYKLVFQDPDCKKLVSSMFEIGTYSTDTVKLV